jgi:exoribonuclease R
MILAGETAAKWCAARHIPVPFRGQPDGVGHEVGIREALYAMRLAYENGQRPNPDELAGLAGMTGPVRLVTKPAPFYAMGVGMYTKATSPLRRFADLVLHWQIHGALSEERRRGSSLEGVRLPTASFLPFSGETLDSMLALTRLRETQISRVERFGLLHWMLQALVRAWQFGEATLPETFRFRVVELLPSLVLGDIDWFGFRAYLLPDGLSHITRMRHVCLGDEFEVKLHHVNLYTSRICVHALRRLDAALPEAERPAFGPL